MDPWVPGPLAPCGLHVRRHGRPLRSGRRCTARAARRSAAGRPVLLVLPLAEIQEPAHGRIRLRRDLDEIEIELTGTLECLPGGHHADLLPVVSDEPDLRRTDPVVDPRLRCDGASPSNCCFP